MLSAISAILSTIAGTRRHTICDIVWPVQLKTAKEFGSLHTQIWQSCSPPRGQWMDAKLTSIGLGHMHIIAHRCSGNAKGEYCNTFIDSCCMHPSCQFSKFPSLPLNVMFRISCTWFSKLYGLVVTRKQIPWQQYEANQDRCFSSEPTLSPRQSRIRIFRMKHRHTNSSVYSLSIEQVKSG